MNNNHTIFEFNSINDQNPTSFDINSNNYNNFNSIDKLSKYNFVYFLYTWYFVIAIINSIFSLSSYIFNIASTTPLFNYIGENMFHNWHNTNMLAINIGILWVFIYLSGYIIFSWYFAILLIIKFKDKKNWWVPVPFLFIGFGIIIIWYIKYIFETRDNTQHQIIILKITLFILSITIINLLTYLPFIKNCYDLILPLTFSGLYNYCLILYLWLKKWIDNKINKYKHIWLGLSLFILILIGIIIFSIIALYCVNKKQKFNDSDVDYKNIGNKIIKPHQISKY